MVYWNTQEVIQAVIGGSLIALSTTLNLYNYGRITGISGAFNSVIKKDLISGFYWKYSFLYGLLLVPVLLYLCLGTQIKFSDSFVLQMFDTEAAMAYNLNLYGWLLGGFLVGFGTKMGNGCTSGHGVCGIPRLSIRSILATLTFMAFGILIATLRYNYPFFTQGSQSSDDFKTFHNWAGIALIIAIHILYMLFLNKNSHIRSELSYSFLYGIIFGLGLLISGMLRVSKIQGFLTMSEFWDPTLMFVMASAVAINLFTFQSILKRDAPAKAETFQVPSSSAKPDLQLIGGASIFGLGWGLSSLCPGPGLVTLFTSTNGMFWVITLVLGQFAFEKLVSIIKRKSDQSATEKLLDQ
eukprot:403359117